PVLDHNPGRQGMRHIARTENLERLNRGDDNDGDNQYRILGKILITSGTTPVNIDIALPVVLVGEPVLTLTAEVPSDSEPTIFAALRAWTFTGLKYTAVRIRVSASGGCRINYMIEGEGEG